MPVAEFPSEVEAPLIALSSCGYFAFAMLITIYHFFCIRKYIGNEAFKYSYLMENPTTFLSYLLLISGVAIGLHSTIGVAIGLHSNIYCNTQKHAGPALYVIFKTILYLTLISRTWQMFQHSVLSYDTRKLIVYSFILIIWAAISIIINSFGVQLKISSNYPRCLIYVPSTFLISSAACDLISGIIGMILFIRPLCRLSKMSDFDIDIRNCAVKQTILGLIAIISTLLMFVLIGLFRAPKFFSTLDCVISTLSIIFMHKWHSNFIQKIFFCCIVSKQEIKNLSNLEIVSNQESTITTTGTSKQDVSDVPNVISENKDQTIITCKPNLKSIPSISVPANDAKSKKNDKINQTTSVSM